MSTSGINFSGLGSGIDTESLISRLLDLERRPATRMQNTQKQLQQRQASYNTVSAQLIGLQSAAGVLNRLRAFDGVTATSTNEDAVLVEAQTGAQTGSHVINVTNLASAQTISSAAQSSQTSALGFAGQIVINGKTINVSASDSLQTLAANINSAQVGTTASIISPSANEFYLTLGSSNTGLQGRITLSDKAGGNLLSSTLGFFGNGTSLRNPIGTTGAASSLFNDSATSIGTLQGQTSPASGTVQIAGQSVTINLASDSLSAIASKINAAQISGVSASVATVTDPISQASRQQLQISGTQSFTDDNNVLANLGVVQRNYGAGRELTAARDATFTIDGLAATRATNTITDAISGVTLTLKKESATSTVAVSRDISGIKSSINAYVKAYNDTLDTVAQLSQYDPATGATGPLFADVTVQNVVDGLLSSVNNEVVGLPSETRALSQIGITLNQNARLVVDDSTLNRVLTGDLSAIGKLFRANGEADNQAVQFVSSTSDTRASEIDRLASVAHGYAVEITRAAEQATYVAAGPTGQLAQDEVITFGGALFGTNDTDLGRGKTLILHQGSSLNDIVSQINGDQNIGGVVTASVDSKSGRLKLTSKQYGTNASFVVKSSVKAQANTSGIGDTPTRVEGVNVAGTINGEAAVGIGQFLTGSQRSENGGPAGRALGLQLRITAASPGSYGQVRVTKGVADATIGFVNSQTDTINGGLSIASSNLDTQIHSIDDDLTTLNDRLKDYEQNLRLRFTAMETAVIKIRSANAGLASLAALSTK